MKRVHFSQFFARKKKKTLRLSTARRASASGAEFEEMAEPNMKLSRALLIVLLLHVVAVGGIIAFNVIKTRQEPEPAITRVARVTPAPSAAPSIAPEAKPAHSPPMKPERKPPPESGKSYTVAKGDTPVTIARKFKVPYNELLAVNHIENPHKLKIGQKLIIPPKPVKAKRKLATD
ncbi:MAG: LysM peptidoglycan-binding domain-containing protein [Verrucomicrobia bacterium]|nr:LysM peptidoglycan-binding domain-containing protein [Verrucomicrobiota bacterium]